jgi:acetyl esterase/lipase
VGTADKFSFLVFLLLIVVAILSYLPAIHPVHWFLRVGVPEVGLAFLLVAFPLAIFLSRNHPKLSVISLSILLVLLLTPWVQALSIKADLKQRWSSHFPKAPARDPLQLGERGGHSVTTQSYKEGMDWDRYTPKESEPKARILFVHGGSWRNGTRQDYSQMFEYLADRGYEVLSLTYTLSGTAPYPAAYLDVQAAIEKAYRPDLPLFLGGRSSGGHLALLASYNNPQLVRGVIGFYPPVDMKWSYDNPSNPAVLNSQEAIVEFLTALPDEKPELYREASPIFQVEAGAPPTLLIHGEPDCLVYHRQSEMLSERLDEVGVEHYLLSLPWTEHGGDVTIYGPTGRLSLWAIEGFLESLVGTASQGAIRPDEN